jgi:tRNA pseudouridine55 synthase
MNGLILVDKPPGCTSHDVVIRLRKSLAERHIGHFGTLDPMATGLLVAAAGKAARFFQFFSHEKKTYLGRIRLGLATDTYDAEGEPLSAESTELPTEQALRRAMAAYLGEIRQVPPPFSAKKFNGQPFYKLARAGRETPRTPSAVVIHRFELIRYDPPEAQVEVECSSGTYIRSLAHDLGRDLGCGGHLSQLRRTASGSYAIDQALSPDAISELSAAGRTDRFLIPLESLLPDHPRVNLEDAESLIIMHGQALLLDRSKGVPDISPLLSSLTGPAPAVVRLFNSQGRLIALARRDEVKGALLPVLVLE